MQQYIIDAHDELIHAIRRHSNKKEVVSYIEDHYPDITRNYLLIENPEQVCIGLPKYINEDKYILHSIKSTEDFHITDILLTQLLAEQAQNVSKTIGIKCTKAHIHDMLMKRWRKEDFGGTSKRLTLGLTITYTTYLACRILMAHISDITPKWQDIQNFHALYQEKSQVRELGDIDFDQHCLRTRHIKLLRKRLYTMLAEYGSTEDCLSKGIFNIINRSNCPENSPMQHKMPNILYGLIPYFDSRYIGCEIISEEMAETEINAALESIISEVSFQFTDIPNTLQENSIKPLFRELRQVPDETLLSAAAIAVLMAAAKQTVMTSRYSLIKTFDEQLNDQAKQERRKTQSIIKELGKIAQEHQIESQQPPEPTAQVNVTALEEKIKTLERENKTLRMENYDLRKSVDSMGQETDEKEKNVETNIEIPQDSVEFPIKHDVPKRCNTNLKYVFITRYEKLMLDLKERFPNCITTTDSYNLSKENAGTIACVVFIVKRIHHGQRYKYQAKCKGLNVPYYYTKHTNVDRIEDELAKWGFTIDADPANTAEEPNSP